MLHAPYPIQWHRIIHTNNMPKVYPSATQHHIACHYIHHDQLPRSGITVSNILYQRERVEMENLNRIVCVYTGKPWTRYVDNAHSTINKGLFKGSLSRLCYTWALYVCRHVWVNSFKLRCCWSVFHARGFYDGILNTPNNVDE